MSELKIYLLGPSRVERDGVSINIGLRKAEALLAYLAVTGQSHSRDALATLLWPEDDERKAHANLRRAIWRLSRALGEGVLEVDRWHAGIVRDADLWVDVVCFRQAIGEHESHGHATGDICSRCISLLKQAESRYTDDFMAGFSLRACPVYDEWQHFQRMDLQDAYAAVLEKLIGVYRAGGDAHHAISLALRRLALDPLHEPAHRLLMELYAASDQKAAALRQYDECAHVLAAELNALPSEETRLLNVAIQAGKFPPAAPNAAIADLSSPSISSIYRMPRQPTTFVGRTTELARIAERLEDSNCRLLTLVGPGGIGKTRLAIRAAEGFAESLAQGAAFAPLAAFREGETQDAGNPVVMAVADSLRIAFHNGDEPESQLLAFLRQKELLLVLDNAEHLLDSMRFVPKILDYAPGVKVMVTSRERLRLRDEWLLPVTGMSYPAEGRAGRLTFIDHETSGTGASSSQYSALNLFGIRARQVQPDFDPEKEYPAVRRICQLVEGMPLAVELAAAWTRVMSCSAIAEEIERGIEILAIDLHDLAERHRSIQAVFEHSWQLLDKEEQGVLQRLSTFRGGFTRDAAKHVAGATVQNLSSLADKSLLQSTSAGRYGFHPLVREFAEGKLNCSPDVYEAARRAHADYYTEYLINRRADLEGHRQLEALNELEIERENSRACWDWAVEHADLRKLNDLLLPLVYYYEYRGLFQEGESACRRAANAVRLTNPPNGVVQMQHFAATLGNLLNNQGWFAWRCGIDGARSLMEEGVTLLRQAGPESLWELAAAVDILAIRADYDDYEKGNALHHEALALAECQGDPFLVGYVKMGLGQTAQARGESRAAVEWLQASLELFDQVGERRFRSYSTNSLGRAALAMGQFDEAEVYLRQAFEIRKSFEDRIGIAYSLLDLGKLAKSRGRYEEARRRIEASTAICDEIGAVVVNVQCLLELGDLARRTGETEQAQALLHCAMNLIRERRLPTLLPICNNYMARLVFAQGRLPEAERYAREGLGIAQEVGHSGEEAAALCILGHVAVAGGRARSAEAEKHYANALTVAVRTGAGPIALDVLLGWSALVWGSKTTESERQRAIELATVVQRHSSSEIETKERAAERLRRYRREVAGAANIVIAGADADLWKVCAALLTPGGV